MTIWIKQGVCGDLSLQMQKALGKLVMLYADHALDFFITSIREGNHAGGSLHYIGHAVDFKRQGIPRDEIIGEMVLLAARTGGRYDVVEYSDVRDIFHVEYDPI